MGFGDRAGRAGTALAVFAATAALVYLGNGLAPRWALMWFAPLPVLLLDSAGGRRHRFRK